MNTGHEQAIKEALSRINRLISFCKQEKEFQDTVPFLTQLERRIVASGLKGFTEWKTWRAKSKGV